MNIKGPKGDSGEGGGGGSYAGNYPIVRTNETSLVLSSNTYYIFENIYGGGEFNIEGFSTQDNNIVNEFIFEVTIQWDNLIGGAYVELVLPSSVVWQNDEHPVMSSGKTYIISIVNNLAVYAEF